VNSQQGDQQVTILTAFFFCCCSSKALLLDCIDSEAVLKLIGRKMVKLVLKFLNESGFPVERQFARCCCLCVRAFDAWTNTKLEGNNKAIKCSETCVKGSMSLLESTKTLLTQDKERHQQKMKTVADSLTKHHTQSNTSIADDLSKEAEGDLHQQFLLRHSCASRRLSQNQWQVLFMEKRVHSKHLPNFERVRLVTLGEGCDLKCSCGWAHRMGFPCRHISHVLEFCFEDHEGFLPEDVDLRHHNMCSHLVACKLKSDLLPEEVQLREKLLSLRRASPIQFPVARGMPSDLQVAIGTKTANFSGSVEDHIESVAKCAPLCSGHSKEAISAVLRKHQLGASFHSVTGGGAQEQEDDFVDTGGPEWDSFSLGKSPEESPEKSMHEMTHPLFKEINIQ